MRPPTVTPRRVAGGPQGPPGRWHFRVRKERRENPGVENGEEHPERGAEERMTSRGAPSTPGREPNCR